MSGSLDEKTVVSMYLVWRADDPDVALVSVHGASARIGLTRHDTRWLVGVIKRVYASDRATRRGLQRVALAPFVDLHRTLCERARLERRRQREWLRDWAELLRQIDVAAERPSSASETPE